MGIVEYAELIKVSLVLTFVVIDGFAFLAAFVLIITEFVTNIALVLLNILFDALQTILKVFSVLSFA